MGAFDVMKQAILTTAANVEKVAANGNSWEVRNTTSHLRNVIREWQDGFDDSNASSEEAAA